METLYRPEDPRILDGMPHSNPLGLGRRKIEFDASLMPGC